MLDVALKKKKEKKNLSTSKTEPFISLNKPLSPHVFILIYLEAWSQIRFSSYFLYMSSFLRSWVFAPNSPTYLNLVLAKVLPPLDSGNWLLPKWSFLTPAGCSLIDYPSVLFVCSFFKSSSSKWSNLVILHLCLNGPYCPQWSSSYFRPFITCFLPSFLVSILHYFL